MAECMNAILSSLSNFLWRLYFVKVAFLSGKSSWYGRQELVGYTMLITLRSYQFKNVSFCFKFQKTVQKLFLET